MIRETSLDAYLNMKATGKLNKQQKKILGFMVPGHQYTRLELYNMLGIPINAVCGRVNEMMKSGVLETNGKIECPISGNNVEGVVRKCTDI